MNERFQAWMRTYNEEIRIGAIAALIAFFFTQGLPLWDDDYNQWLAQANGGLFEIIKRLILPFTTEPQTWGYSDRPVVVLIYKILFTVFGYWGTGYFFVKSAIFGGLCGTLYHFMRRLGAERETSLLTLSLFVLCANVLASVIWLSDFGVLSQLVLTVLLFHSFHYIEKGPTSVAVYKKGFKGLPAHFKRFIAVFAATLYFGAKIKGDVRLAPVILLAYLAIYRREKFKVYVGPMVGAFLISLPFSGALFHHLPPFIPGAAGYSGWTFGAFSLTRVIEFVMSDMFVFRGPPLALLGAVGTLVSLAVLGYGGYRVYREKLDAPGDRTGFLLIWTGVAVLACGMLTKQNPTFQLRYTLIAMVPAVLFLSTVFQAGYQEFAKSTRWFKPVVYALIAAQGLLHGFHVYNHRRDMGRTMVAINKIYQEMEKNHPNSSFALFPGFLSYGYRADTSESVKNRKVLNETGEAARMPAGNTFAASWSSTLDSQFSVQFTATGCDGALFDLIAPCKDRDGAVLLRYEGIPAELSQAEQLDRQGNLKGARDVLESYLARVPGNHGVQFLAGFYNYRLGDFARMEVNYDRIGPYFDGHPSVLYNWGLAKQGVQKFSEAAKLLEKVYAGKPGDYGVGFNLADAYFKAGRKSRALATVDQLLKVYPDNKPLKDAYNNWSK